MQRRFVVTYDVPLRDDGFPRFEERLAHVDPTHTVKGAFFDDLVRVLGDDLQRHLGSLRSPPRGGKFLPFSSYPMHDYAFLVHHAAKKRYPNVSEREGVRRLQRHNVEAFSRTTPGRVMTAMMTDLRKDHDRLPDAFKLSRNTGIVETRAIEDRAVEFIFRDSHPWIDSGEVGTLEGIGAFFKRRLRLEVELDSMTSGSLVCRFLRD